MRGAINRDQGLTLAIEAVGGVCALARRANMSHQRVSKLRRVPRGLLFTLASASGLEPEQLRPDLKPWIEAEQQRRWMERARQRFAIRSGLNGTATARRGGDAAVMDLLDLGLVVAAVRFVAGEVGMTPRAIMAAPLGGSGGAPTPEQSARSRAMALAVTVGRVSSEAVAGVMGVTRQAVDNAAERYLRARDGDEDAEDGRVIERGRHRRAKVADERLWAAERRFLAQLALRGIAGTPPQLSGRERRAASSDEIQGGADGGASGPHAGEQRHPGRPAEPPRHVSAMPSDL